MCLLAIGTALRLCVSKLAVATRATQNTLVRGYILRVVSIVSTRLAHRRIITPSGIRVHEVFSNKVLFLTVEVTSRTFVESH